MTIATEELPTWDQIRDACNRAAAEQGEWAGAPLPVDDLRLVIAKRYKFQGLNGFALNKEKPEEMPADAETPMRVRNEWYSRRLRANVVIWQIDNRVGHFTEPSGPGERVKFAVNTIGASRAWSVDAEIKAMEKLRELVGEYMFARYLLTGSILETSPRSRVTYLFRRLRPTIALRASGPDHTNILAALCLHPIGHYEESFAGVMVPTDDVIAHLLLMRADEHGFWKKANHHNLHSARSGI